MLSCLLQVFDEGELHKACLRHAVFYDLSTHKLFLRNIANKSFLIRVIRVPFVPKAQGITSVLYSGSRFLAAQE